MDDQQKAKIKGVGEQFALALEDLTGRVEELEATVASQIETIHLQEKELEIRANRITDLERRCSDLQRDKNVLYRGNRKAFQELKEHYAQLMQPGGDQPAEVIEHQAAPRLVSVDLEKLSADIAATG